MLKKMRKKIHYPQNNSRNVNKVYREAVGGATLSDDNQSRIKREIRSKLDEVDAQQVQEISKTLAQAFKISACADFRTGIENWLNDSWYTSHTKALVAYMAEKTHPIEFEKLDRLAQYANKNGICFEDPDDVKSEKGTFQSELIKGVCTWVPAAFCAENTRRVYGGVCLYPQLKNVTNLSNNSNSNSFINGSNSGSGSGASGGSGGRGSGSNNNNKENRPSTSSGHGNSLSSKREQHMYVIEKHNPGGNLYQDYKRDSQKQPTLTVKVGISGRDIRDGQSVRGQTQADKLNNAYIEKQVLKLTNKGIAKDSSDVTRIRSYYNSHPVYTCQIKERVEAGVGARSTIRNMEKNVVETTIRTGEGTTFGKHVLPGNREPATRKLKEQLFKK